jgi:hypothetical protein
LPSGLTASHPNAVGQRRCALPAPVIRLAMVLRLLTVQVAA